MRLVLLALVMGGLGCGSDAKVDGRYVRLWNDTEYDFDSVTMWGADSPFGPLAAGAESDYVKVELGLLYAVDGGVAEGDGKRFWGQVTDHVGDVPLGDGFYTFQISTDKGVFLQGYDGSVFFQLL